MRSYILVLVFLSFTFSAYSKVEKRVDVISYNINLKLDTNYRKLDIQANILIKNTDTTGVIKFLFCDWIKIKKAQLNGKNLVYSQSKDTLFLHIDSSPRLNLKLDYSLPIDSFKQDKVIALTRPMKWCPYIYDDICELNSDIIVPKEYSVYSTGNLLNMNTIENEYHYKFQNRINSGFPIFFAPVGYYKETAKTQNDINIKFYFHNSDSVLTNSIIKESLLGLDFSTKYIGKYKRQNLTYIELPGLDCSQSLETVVLMGSNFIKYFGLYPDIRFWPSHETIHQWIGAGYFNSISKKKKNRWFIEESLTEYLRYVYVEKTYGADSLKNEINRSIDYYNKNRKGTVQDVTISANLPNDITYCIGPLILHNVRLEIGDEKWHKFIKNLYAMYYSKILDYDGFKKKLSEYAKPTVITKMEKSMETKGIPKEFPKQ
jgi:hypothetical protein